MRHFTVFTHPKGISGVIPGQKYGDKYFYKWWDKACTNLGIEGVDLYGGTKHSTATALGQLLTPEQIKQVGPDLQQTKPLNGIFNPGGQNPQR